MPRISYFWLFLIVVFGIILSYRTIYAQLPGAPVATTPTTANPGALNSGSTQFTLNWTHSGSGITKFEVSGDSLAATDVATTARSYGPFGSYTSNDSTWYNFQVVAINGTARSDGAGTAGKGPDRIAPTSAAPTISTGNAGANGWYTSTVSMYISSADAVGVTLEKHKRNAEAYNVGSATDTWADTDDGTDTWYGYAEDSQGNYITDASAFTVNVDQTAPSVSASTLAEGTNPAYQYASGTTIYYNNAVSGGFSVSNSPTDATSGVAKATFPTMTGFTGGGDDATSPYSALYSWTATTTTYSGSPSLTATDNAGLVSPSGGTFTVTLDNVVPSTPALLSIFPGATDTNTYTSDDQPQISWATDSTDSGSGPQGYQLSINGAWQNYVEGDPISAGQLTSQAAANTFKVKARDYVENFSAESVAISYYYDNSTPTATSVTGITASGGAYGSGATTVYYNRGTAGSFTVTATATDAQSGIQKINLPALTLFASGGGDDTVAPYETPYTWTGTSTQDGSATVTAYNKASLTATASFNAYLDITAPTEPATPSTTPATSTVSYSGNATPTLTWVTDSTDTGGSGVALYQIKSDSNSTWTDFTKASALPAGYMQSKAAANTISIRAKDNVVNYSVGTVGTTFYCDTSAPSAVDTSVTGITVTGGAYAKQGSWIVYYNRGTAGSFTVTGTTADPESGVQKIEFPTLAGFDAGTPGGNVGAPGPYTYAYNWTASATQDAIANITAYNNAGLTTQAGFDVQLDITKPTGLALSWGAIDSSSITVSPTGSTLADTEAGVAALPVLIQYDANSTSFVTADISSGWRDTTAWTATGLSANTPHAFRIIARDNVGNLTTALTPTPAYKYTMAANADIVSANGLGTSTWATVNQMDNATLTFSSANLDASPKKIQYYRYIWDTSPTTAVTVAVGRSAPSGNLAFPDGVDTKRNSKSLYLHVRPYNGDDQPAQDTQHYGPYYCVETKRRLRGNKFFDDDGVLVEMR